MTTLEWERGEIVTGSTSLKRPTIYKELTSASSANWKDAVALGAFNAIGGLLPLWGTALLYLTISKKLQLSDFVGRGEFALYAAAFFAPSFYVVLRDFAVPFVNRVFFSICLVVGLLVSTLVFAFLIIVRDVATLKAPFLIDEGFLQVCSVVLLIASLALSLIISLLDNIRTNVDVKELNQRAADRLEDDFDKLG